MDTEITCAFFASWFNGAGLFMEKSCNLFKKSLINYSNCTKIRLQQKLNQTNRNLHAKRYYFPFYNNCPFDDCRITNSTQLKFSVKFRVEAELSKTGAQI